MYREPITKYEHQKLESGETDDSVIKALQEYYGTDGTPYYSLIHKGIKFNQYVGIIQVGSHQIEVLPKVDQVNDGDINWRKILIEVSRMTSGIEAEATSESQLQIQHNSILDLYIELFIKECERLTHLGLIKRYRPRRENKQALKGRLHIPGQIQHNLVHKERFHVDYSSYEKDHLINQILKKTLVVLSRLAAASVFQNRIKKQLLYFENVSNFLPTKAVFDSIQYGRKNSHYKQAIEIAKLILLNYHPDISQGEHNVLALMFDMNTLWEKYIAMQMRRYLIDEFLVETQERKVFWESIEDVKHLKPDIILRDRETQAVSLIIDNKWKLPENMKPSDQDLRQMFAYNRLFDSQESILLYPGINESLEGEYKTDNGGTCRVQTLQILNGDGQLLRDESLFGSVEGLLQTSDSITAR